MFLAFGLDERAERSYPEGFMDRFLGWLAGGEVSPLRGAGRNSLDFPSRIPLEGISCNAEGPRVFKPRLAP